MKAIPLNPALARWVQRPAAPARVRAVLAEGWRVVREWRRRARSRAELADRTLRDIGLTRADVWAEIDKPFWRQ